MRKEIGARVKSLRELNGFTQEDVAQSLGMTRQRLSRIEKGLVDFSYDLLLKISDYFNVDISFFTKEIENQTVSTFRAQQNGENDFSKIEEMIDLFYANKSLFIRMSLEDENE